MPHVELPFELTPHTDADAEQVMANFEAIVAVINGQLDSTNLAASVLGSLLKPGVILPTGGTAADAGCLLCEGQAVSRTTYAALFARIGTTFGAGNGTTTFNIPDLRGRAPIGTDSGAGRIYENNLMGQFGGNYFLQQHNHGLATSGFTGIESTLHTHSLGWFVNIRHEGGGFAYPNVEPGGGTSTGSESAYHSHALGGTTNNEGIGGSQNMPPYLNCKFQIKT